MIDIHSHILPTVDDGARNIEESIEILKNLSLIGYTDIILTPHYIKDSKFNSSIQNNQEILNILKEELLTNNIDINLYLGNEIYIDNDIDKLLEKDAICPLNNSKYLLIELPMNGIYEDYIEIFKSLIEDNYKVILAHPERYTSFQKDYTKINELLDIGVYFQCNIESILGRYGKKAKKLVKKLLKEKKVSYIATDIHHPQKDYKKILKAKKKIKRILKEEEYKKVFINNPSRIIK